MELWPIWITQTRYTFPTLTNKNGMIGTIRKMEDAKYVANIINEHPILKKKIEELEEENKRLKEAAGNE